MKNTNQSKTLILFYVLVAYVVFQFVWWAFLLFELNSRIYSNPLELNRRWLMIIGEGSVFLLLLFLGVRKIHKNIQKEYQLTIQQQNFMLSVTHELKTPLASIKLLLETLVLRDIEKEKQKALLQSGLVETERLNALIENILFSARIDNNNFSLSLERINLSEYIQSILKTSAVYNENRNQIEVNIDENTFAVVDKHSIYSIVVNLIENAIKYSPPNKVVQLSLKMIDNLVVLTVADQGIGIPTEEHSKVFEKFYRIGNELTRTTKGTGLGLYIVKSLVEQHSATIAIKNNTPEGTIFEIAFNNSPFEEGARRAGDVK
ncbi:MAG: two-component sensor histidine kinase [Bacteroidetes bacterium]|nr:two-component sensor histidine kinase [Bacteroidota bacterium]